ncbi:holo-ACP synthase [Candidatus Blochmanniella vafra]|nr:holo-ACP synthase [Candidatus Blochmannia vafer]
MDIIEIDRIKKIIVRSGDKLAQRILSKLELEIYYQKKNSVYFLSKRFVAKEAASKAFGTGMKQGIAFNQFEIFNDDYGQPGLRFFSCAAQLAERLALKKTYVTLTDTRVYACAVVILEC